MFSTLYKLSIVKPGYALVSFCLLCTYVSGFLERLLFLFYVFCANKTLVVTIFSAG